MLATEDSVGGLTPRIGRKHLRVVAIDGFPKASVPGILAALDTLPIEYRWNTRAILMDPEEARSFLDKVRKKWRSKRSEEHTSELQSPDHLVCRLLLEKKKK